MPIPLHRAVVPALFAAGALLTNAAFAANTSPDGGVPGVTKYDTRAEFNAAAPGLPCEDFSGPTVTTLTAFDAPLNSTTNNALYHPGDIIAGFTLRDNPLNGDTPGLGFMPIGYGQFGTTNPVIYINVYGDAAELVFSPPATGIGFNLHNFPTDFSTDDVVLYNLRGDSFGTAIAEGNNAGTFFGFTSTTPVARIFIRSTITQAEGFSVLCFGDGFNGDLIFAGSFD